jgi:hypothetical protein
MGRRPWTQRLTVEQCVPLTVRDFVQFEKRHYLRRISTTLSWIGRSAQMQIECMMSWDQAQLVLHLSKPLASSGIFVRDQVVYTTSTACRFGGKRLWLLCPGLEGNSCGRKCTALYLPPGTPVFACRLCYGLTYLSAQTHDKRIDRLLANHFLLSEALSSQKIRERLLALNAYSRMGRLLKPRRIPKTRQ